MKTKILLAELERYILVVLQELKELRPKDYAYFHSVFPLLIPSLESQFTKQDMIKIYPEGNEIALEILKYSAQNEEFIVFLEEVFSTRYYKEDQPELFWPDKITAKKISTEKISTEKISTEKISTEKIPVEKTPKAINDFDPSLIQMAKNFGTAMLDSAKTGFKKVTPEQHAERMAICNTCQFWDGKARMGMGKCAKCGCTGAKQWLSSSSCPINLWGSLP
jgi:hypothetical protein